MIIASYCLLVCVCTTFNDKKTNLILCTYILAIQTILNIHIYTKVCSHFRKENVSNILLLGYRRLIKQRKLPKQ